MWQAHCSVHGRAVMRSQGKLQRPISSRTLACFLWGVCGSSMVDQVLVHDARGDGGYTFNQQTWLAI